jgi:hypothetical protein
MCNHRFTLINLLLPLLMCAGLVYSSIAPPVRAVAEEHETEHGSQREQGKREHQLRQRSIPLRAQRDSQSHLWSAPSRQSASTRRLAAALILNAAEASGRNGLGAPLRL